MQESRAAYLRKLKDFGETCNSQLMRLDTPLVRWLSIFGALAFSYSIIFALSYFDALTYVDPNHIGSMFKMAIDVLEGYTLYGQTYSQYGPVPTYIHAAAIFIFGRNVIVPALVTMVFACATIFLLQRVWSRIIPFPYVVITIVLQAIIQPINSFPWPNGYLAFFAAGTLLAVVSYFEMPQVHKLIIAGLCTAAGVLCRQQGIILFPFVFLCLLFISRSSHQNLRQKAVASFWYFLSSFSPVAIYLLYLQSRHMLIDFYKQTLLIIPVAYTSGNLSLIDHLEKLLANFFLPEKTFFVSLWYIFAVICVCYMVALFLKNSFKDTKSRVLFLCSGFALIGLLNGYPLPDNFRFAHGMAPATGVVVYLLYMAFSKAPQLIRYICVLTIVCLTFSPTIVFIYNIGYSRVAAARHGFTGSFEFQVGNLYHSLSQQGMDDNARKQIQVAIPVPASSQALPDNLLSNQSVLKQFISAQYGEHSDSVQNFLNSFQSKLSSNHPLKTYKSEFTQNGCVKLSAPLEIAGTCHSAEDEQFYTKFDKMLKQYKKLYPDTSFISLGVEPLFPTFIQHNKNGHQLPFLWWSKTGTMYDGGEKNTINALLYPDYFEKLHGFIVQNKPLLYTYGQHIDGYKPIFENPGGTGFPVPWANQWGVRPIVSIQAPEDRAEKFLASTNPAEFFTAPKRIVITNVSGKTSAQLQPEYTLNKLFDSRSDTFMSYTSLTPFSLELDLQLQEPSVVSKMTLYPRAGFEKLLPRSVYLSGSIDGVKWETIAINDYQSLYQEGVAQPGSAFSFNPQKIKFLRINTNSSTYENVPYVQIAEIVLD